MARTPRVLLIGLDAGESSLIREWARSGYLPNLRRILDGGASADLSSTARHFPDVVWPVIYTSKGPARFEPYFFIRPKQATARLEIVDHTLSGHEPFWVTAARHGRRCAVIDAPKIGLQPPAGGVQLSGWGCHATLSPLASQPADVAAGVLARHGRYPLLTCDDHGPSLSEYTRLRQLILTAVEARRRLLCELLRSAPWDLFFAVFSETHCAGHQFWHLHDAAHPQHVAGGDQLHSAMRDVYQAVDRAIGDLVATAGDDTCVVICSGHGMQPEYHGRDLLPTLLEWWGMRGPDNIVPDRARERTVVVRPPLMNALRQAVPLRWQYAAKGLLPRPIVDELTCRFVGVQQLDVRARAFYVPNNDLTPTIRINLIGRDPFGKVAPGREHAELRDVLITRLRELIHPDTGRPALRDVTAVHDHYEGAYAAGLPDIVGFWSPERFIGALYSPGYGTVVGGHRDHRTGGHSANGFLALSQPDGAAPHLAGADIKDIAPTVLRLLGVPVPPDMEGTARVKEAAHSDAMG